MAVCVLDKRMCVLCLSLKVPISPKLSSYVVCLKPQFSGSLGRKIINFQFVHLSLYCKDESNILSSLLHLR